MDRNSYNTRDPVLVLTSKGRNQDPTPPEPEYVQDVTAKAGISVTGSKVNKQVGVRLSEDEGNSLSFGVDDGLYASTVKDEIKDGIGTKVVDVTTKAKLWDKIKRKFGYGDVQKIAIDLQPPTVDVIGGVKLSTKAENAAEIDAAGNLFVSKQSANKTLVDGENTKVKDIPDTNKVAVDVFTGDGTNKKGVYGIDTIKTDNSITGVDGLLYSKLINLTPIEQQLYAHQIEINAIFSGINVLKSGIPVLQDIQDAIVAAGGRLAMSWNLEISGADGLMIDIEDVPSLAEFANIMTAYMRSTTVTHTAKPYFTMVYDGTRFIVTNGADNILISPSSIGNDVLKISQLGGAEILNINTPKTKDYYARWELSELAGFDALDTRSSIVFDQYAVASPVVGLKVPKDGIGELMGFDTQFDNHNPDGTGQREYRVKIKFLVFTELATQFSEELKKTILAEDVNDDTTTITIGNNLDINDGAFHMWTAGIEPEIDYSNQHTEHDDIYTFQVNNLRVTPVTITLRKNVFIENRLRKFYFGISMKGWFPTPDTVNYKLYDYVELFLEEVIPSGNIKSKNKIRNTGHTLSKRTISECTDKD